MYGDMIEDVNSERPDESLAEMLRGSELQTALSQLSERMRHVLELRFGLSGAAPKTLEEVGTELGVTRERVRQLESPRQLGWSRERLRRRPLARRAFGRRRSPQHGSGPGALPERV